MANEKYCEEYRRGGSPGDVHVCFATLDADGVCPMAHAHVLPSIQKDATTITTAIDRARVRAVGGK